MRILNLAYESVVRAALVEDVGSGDITTLCTVTKDKIATAVLVAKSPMILCGMDVAASVFTLVDSSLEFKSIMSDGDRLNGTRETLGSIHGCAQSLLTAERVALNFLQRLSGIATLTSAYVDAVSGTKARIVDTRKTTPGLRALEKYAVRTGGGHNHRFGLSDGILIKDNHIAAAGGVAKAIRSARACAPHTMKIEVEAKQIQQVEEALAAGADIILLDNMTPQDLRQAVEMIDGRAVVEASGGVNLDTVRTIAETGVDLISVGAITHSALSVDISLDFLDKG
jgi:nicotinate-nucleotide pyrophosphorylase (carboxylating)